MENKILSTGETISYSADVLDTNWNNMQTKGELTDPLSTFPGEPQRDPDPKKRPETEPHIQPEVEPGEDDDDDDDDDDPYTEPEIGDDPDEERKKQTIM